MVKSMDDDGYLVGVLKKGNINDFAEKFKVWKAISKIYVESKFLPGGIRGRDLTGAGHLL